MLVLVNVEYLTVFEDVTSECFDVAGSFSGVVGHISACIDNCLACDDNHFKCDQMRCAQGFVINAVTGSCRGRPVLCPPKLQSSETEGPVHCHLAIGRYNSVSSH